MDLKNKTIEDVRNRLDQAEDDGLVAQLYADNFGYECHVFNIGEKTTIRAAVPEEPFHIASNNAKFLLKLLELDARAKAMQFTELAKQLKAILDRG